MIRADMRMADEQVIVFLLVQNPADNGGIVAMRDGDLLSIQLQLGELIEHRKPDRIRITRQASAIPVVVAPDQRGRMTREQVENPLASNIAAVDQMLSTGVQKLLDSRGGGIGAVMRVAEDADQHNLPTVTPRRAFVIGHCLTIRSHRANVGRLMLKYTPFHDFHQSAGGKLVDFAGWEMPIMYRSIIEEHEQTRRSGSIFDVSHMGRLYFSGPDAAKFLSHVVTRKIDDQKVGTSRYSLVCNPAGGVMDDIIVSRDTKQWLVVCNASNREKLVKHFLDIRQKTGMDFDLSDQTEATAMIALQGPKVIDRVADILPVELRTMKRYTFVSDSIMLIKFTVFRSGYTGEDGVELIIPAKAASMGMKLLGGKFDKTDALIKPAGLGARDTLRLEAGMPLYGHELSESLDPISAGLGWAVDLAKEFIGVEPLRVIQQNGPARKLVGLELEGRRIARQGTPIRSGEKVVGEVTSGTLSPTLGKSIAMAYVDSAFAAEGTALQADLKGTLNPAKVVKLPFYKRQ